MSFLNTKSTQLKSASFPNVPVRNPSSGDGQNPALQRHPSLESKSTATSTLPQPNLHNRQREKSEIGKPRHVSMPIQPSIRSQSMPVQLKQKSDVTHPRSTSHAPESHQTSSEKYTYTKIKPSENSLPLETKRAATGSMVRSYAHNSHREQDHLDRPRHVSMPVQSSARIQSMPTQLKRGDFNTQHELPSLKTLSDKYPYTQRHIASEIYPPTYFTQQERQIDSEIYPSTYFTQQERQAVSEIYIQRHMTSREHQTSSERYTPTQSTNKKHETTSQYMPRQKSPQERLTSSQMPMPRPEFAQERLTSSEMSLPRPKSTQERPTSSEINTQSYISGNLNKTRDMMLSSTLPRPKSTQERLTSSEMSMPRPKSTHEQLTSSEINTQSYINDNPRKTREIMSSSTLPRRGKTTMHDQAQSRSERDYEGAFRHPLTSTLTPSLPESMLENDIYEEPNRFSNDMFALHRYSAEPPFAVHRYATEPPFSVHRSMPERPNDPRSASLPDPVVHRSVDDLTSTRPGRYSAKPMSAPKSPKIPDEILRMDNRSVELYLRILETGIETKHDIRVIVVGKQGAGKTCLIRRLLHESLDNVPSTNGIEIHVKKCKVRLCDGKWIMEKAGNIRRRRNVRLLSSVLHHIRKESSSDVRAIGNHVPEADTWNTTTQNDMFYKEEANEQTATANNDTLDSAFKDLRDVVDAENELDDEEYATLTLWDFAGDKEFYNTHQTFLSHDALYLVVTNLCDKNENEAMNILKFWFDSIHCYGAGRDYVDELLDPPVLAIGTHKDLFRGDCSGRLIGQVQNVMHASRRHLRSCFTISNINDNDDVFDDVKHAIFNTVRGQADWGKEMPLKFIQLEKLLDEKLNEGHMILSFSNILSLASRMLKPIRFTEEIDLFLRYQHEIGNLIYFSDIPEYIILDPQWLANAFSSIVTAEKFQMELLGYDEWDDFQRTGVLKTRLLNALFSKQPKNIQIHQDHIVKVMEKFDILIRPRTATGDNRNKEERHYFVPCMIKTNVLSNIDDLCKVKDNNKTTCLCFVFNFLPQAFINHLIVSCIRRYTTSRVRDPVNNKKQPALFEGLGVFDISETGCEKLLVAAFDNTVQIQMWKYGNVPYRVYSDVHTFIRDEIHRIQCEKYRMINMSYQLQFKCAQTRYNNLEGLRNCHVLQYGQSYCCEEHDDVHEFQDDWFVGQKDDSTISKEEKRNFEKTTRRLFERIENHKSQNSTVNQTDYNKKESSKGQQAVVPAYKSRIQRNYKNIVSSIKHDKIVDHLIQEDVFTLDDSEIINSCPAQTHKNRKLVQILLKRGERGYREFINALRCDPVYDELADIIENTTVV